MSSIAPSLPVRLVGWLVVIIANLLVLNAYRDGTDAPWQWVLWTGSLLAVVWLSATRPAPVQPEQPSGAPAGFAAPPGSALWPRWTPSVRGEALLALGVVGLGVFLRLYAWDKVPPGIWSDELLAAANGVRVLEGAPAPLFGAMPLVPEWPQWVHTFNLYSWYVAANLWLFGVGHFGIKMLSILPGCVAVGGQYWLLRELGGARLALLGTLMLDLSRWHLTQSRFEWDGTFATTAGLLGCAAIARALRTGRAHWAALGGVIIGISQYSYLASRLTIVGVVLFFAVALLLGQAGRRVRGRVLVAGLACGLAFAVAAGPVIVFSFENKEVAEARIKQLRIDEPEEGDSPVGFSDNLRAYCEMFTIAGPGNSRQNIPGEPLLPGGVGELFLLGGALSVLLLRRGVGHVMIHAMFWSGLMAGVLSSSGGGVNAHRIGIVLPFCYAAAAWALDVLFGAVAWALTRLWSPGAWPARVGAGVMVAAAGAAVLVPGLPDASDYFVRFGQSRALNRAVRAAEHLQIAQYVQEAARPGEAVWIDAYFKDLTLDLLLYRPPDEDGRGGGLYDPPYDLLPMSGRRLLPESTPSGSALVIAHPSLAGELRARYPRGQWKERKDRFRKVSFVSGRLDGPALAQAWEQTRAQAAVFHEGLFLLPEDLAGRGVTYLVRGDRDASPIQGMDVVAPEELSKLPQERVNRFGHVREWHGVLTTQSAGPWMFSTTERSPEATLWIDGSELRLSHKGEKLHLEAGEHTLRVRSNNDVYALLTVEWAAPGKDPEPIPGSALRPLPPPDLASQRLSSFDLPTAAQMADKKKFRDEG